MGDNAKTAQQQQEIFQMKRRILNKDYDVRKLTRQMKILQEKEKIDAQEIIQGDQTGVHALKQKILDLKREIRRKEEWRDAENKRINDVIFYFIRTKNTFYNFLNCRLKIENLS